MAGEHVTGHDIVVIGASTGGVEALLEIVAGLPSEIAAAVFVALHMGPGFASRHRDCGTAGMLSIKARGGLAVVQDPREAIAPDMPRSVVAHVDVDHVVPLRDIPGLLARLAREPAGAAPAHIPGALMKLEGDAPGVAAEIVCPSCQGKLTESALNGFQRFRCHVGHAFSLESVAAEQADEVERALWAAVRALEEGAALARRLAASASGHLRQRFEDKEAAQAQQAHVIRNFILGGSTLSRNDAADVSSAVPTPPGA